METIPPVLAGHSGEVDLPTADLERFTVEQKVSLPD
jgi:hypothetical protein